MRLASKKNKKKTEREPELAESKTKKNRIRTRMLARPVYRNRLET